MLARFVVNSHVKHHPNAVNNKDDDDEDDSQQVRLYLKIAMVFVKNLLCTKLKSHQRILFT